MFAAGLISRFLWSGELPSLKPGAAASLEGETGDEYAKHALQLMHCCMDPVASYRIDGVNAARARARARTRTHTRAHTHARPHVRTHAHTHTHTERERERDARKHSGASTRTHTHTSVSVHSDSTHFDICCQAPEKRPDAASIHFELDRYGLDI